MRRLGYLLAALLVGCGADARAPGVRIIDGDTIAIAGEHIRLLDIDAPERGKRARCKAEWVWAEQARDALAAEVNGAQDIRLERYGLDRYSRTLARVYADGRNVGEDMIAAHMAVRYGYGKPDWCRMAATGASR